MRFSDMMGSGDEKSSKRSTMSESEALIADALAPYLDAGSSNAVAAQPVVAEEPAEVVEVEVAEVAEVAEVVEVAEAPVVPIRQFLSPAPVAPVAPIAAVASVAPVEHPPVAPRDPIAATIADFAPISDDLLPRRR
jgi:hypothetical protein